MRKLIFLLFALSGAVGLTYQIVWARLLILIFGNTTYSLTIILSIFMAGLASGSAFFGFISDKLKRHIKAWGLLEILTGISAFFVLYSLPYVKSVYNPSIFASKFLLSAAIIFPATFFMGGTLPLLIKAFSLETRDLATETSKLYFFEVFPHILVAVSPEGTGVFFLGSEMPIKINKENLAQRYTGKVYQDLNEWNQEAISLEKLLGFFVGDEKTVKRFVGQAPALTDDRPRTEYFYLRHKFRPLANISADWVHPIDPEFDKELGIRR